MTASEFLLADSRTSLERQLNVLPHNDLATVFAAWMAQEIAPEMHVYQAVTAALQRSGAQQDFQTVAALGFALNAGLLDKSAHSTLKKGLERLIGRQPFVDEIPMPFCSDAVGLLGVAVGTRDLTDGALTDKVISWLSSFLKHIWDMEGTEDWQRTMVGALNHVLGDGLPLAVDASFNSADVRVALRARHVLPPAIGEIEEREASAALNLMTGTSIGSISYERAVMRLTALKWIIRANPVAIPGRMTVENIVKLLERVPAGLRKWTCEKAPRTANAAIIRWEVNNEYHVQNLLWTMLAPLLPDLDDEQYLTKIGHKSPRSDLYISSLKLIIEVKFLRSSDKFQKIIDEIAADTALYGAMGNDCQDIVAFVWDDSARSHEHDYLKQGLRKLQGITDVVVISRPGGWFG